MHYEQCTDCGLYECYPHFIWCDSTDQDTCVICGLSEPDIVIGDIKHSANHFLEIRDGVLVHGYTCFDCGISDTHAYTPFYRKVNNNLHTESCMECGWFNQSGSHMANCGENDDCAYCGAENVIVAGHVNHLEDNRFTYLSGGTLEHLVVCPVCNDLLYTSLHFTESGRDVCLMCGEEEPANYQAINVFRLPADLKKMYTEAFANNEWGVYVIPDGLTWMAKDAIPTNSWIICKTGSPAERWAVTNGVLILPSTYLGD